MSQLPRFLDRSSHDEAERAVVSLEADTVGEAIAHWARVQPRRAALLEPERRVSWSQLHSSVEGLGDALAQFGVTPSHRVGLLVPEGLAGSVLILGVCARCLLVPIHPGLSAAELAQAAVEARLDALVVPESLAASVDLAGLDGVLPLKAYVPPDGGVPVLLPMREPGHVTKRGPAAPEGAAVLLRSSGTTGTPKLVPVTHGNLLAMAANMASPRGFGLGGGDRAACILPLYYAAGLKNLLIVPLMAGGSVAFPPPARAFHIAEWLPGLEPTFFCSTPATLRGILERLEHPVRGSSLRFIMCGASYLPEDLRRAAADAFGIPIVEYYGLSEAGVVTANPLEPGQARPGTVGRVIGGELCIVDAQLRPVPPGERGEIQVRGPGVSPGYLLADGSLSEDMRDGALLTGDVGELDADGFLRMHGRLKEVINRGGEKVFPYEVEAALLEHGDLLEAAVYGVPHPRLGQSVAAAVVLKSGCSVTPGEIGARLTGRLAAYKIPRRVTLVDSLPKGKTGKVLRNVLAEQHGRLPASQEQVDSLVEAELLELWRRLLGNDGVGPDDDFLDAGGDSLLATDLLLEVERITGVSSDGWNLATLTVREVTRAVLHAGPAPTSETGLLTLARPGEGAPLFFCHGDIASRGFYAHRLSGLLSNANPVWVLNYPPRYASLGIEAMAQVYLDEVLRITSLSANTPVHLAGWCNAGLVVWHLAHLLRRRGIPVGELLLIETPSLNGTGSIRRIAQILRLAGRWVPGRAGRFLRDEAMRGVWALRRKGMAEFAVATMNRERPEIPGDLRRRSILYYQRIARYVPPPLDVPVTCLVAQEGLAFDTDPRRWSALAPAVRKVSIPGTHYSAVVGNQSSLAARLSECLGFPSDRAPSAF